MNVTRNERELVERRRDQPYTEMADSDHRTSHLASSGVPHIRDPSTERHRERDHRERMQRISPEKAQEAEQTPRRMRHDDPRRADLHRGNGQYPGSVDAFASPLQERHPERLMQGHSQPITKDAEKFVKYSSMVGVSRRGERDVYPEGECYVDPLNRQHLDPNMATAAARYAAGRVRRRGENMLRNDSLSSDLSDCVRPPTLKPQKPRKGGKHSSMSSSDDEMPTTPEGTSWEDQEYEHEKGLSFILNFPCDMLTTQISLYITHDLGYKLLCNITQRIL